MLADQVQNLDAILKSSEYFDLHEANRLTFEAIAKAGQDQIRASEVQQVNRKRYLAKRALQEKFWPDQDLMESKTKSES
jgi:hypothetical protein